MPAISPQDAYDSYRARRFFGSLDGLRFICIAMVLWHHGTIWGEMSDPARILTRGFTGVDFFFVLSGYLITTLLLREESRDGRFSLRGFYWRRILRIVPVYFLAVSAIGAWWILARGQTEWVSLLPYYYLFLGNFLNGDIPLLSPMWSLSVEEQYYLIWPALLLIIPLVRFRLILLVILIGLCVLSAAGVLSPFEPFPPTEVAEFVLPVSSYAAILIGSATALILHQKLGFQVLWRLLGARWAAPIALVSVFVALQFLPEILRGWPNLIVHVLMAMALASLVLREDHLLAGPLKINFISRIGKISYGLYIWHLVGRHIGVEITGFLGLTGWTAAWFAMAAFVFAAILIAELSFRFFESYFLRLKDTGRFRSPQKAQE